MNRELKFRAWDGKNKQMSNIYSLVQIAQTEKLFPFNWEWLEYTGLKDKNGKEICEDDIIENLDGRYQVVFCEGQFMLDDGDYQCLCISLDESKCEIIGNIYENPKLLKSSGENNGS